MLKIESSYNSRKFDQAISYFFKKKELYNLLDFDNSSLKSFSCFQVENILKNIYGESFILYEGDLLINYDETNRKIYIFANGNVKDHEYISSGHFGIVPGHLRAELAGQVGLAAYNLIGGQKKFPMLENTKISYPGVLTACGKLKIVEIINLSNKKYGEIKFCGVNEQDQIVMKGKIIARVVNKRFWQKLVERYKK